MENCIFCQIVRGELQAWKVLETETTLAFLDINPVSLYHTLVIPKAHFSNVFDCPESVLQDVMLTVKRVVNLYQEKLGLTDIQIVNSSGSAAQQDVFHLHFHLIPRAAGDGQDIKWTTHPEYRTQFDQILENLAS